MPSWIICRETVRVAARSPAWWLLVALLLSAWRGLEVFMPLGLATDGLHRSVGHYEIAFLGGVLAMLLVIAPMQRFDVLLRDQSPVSRTLTEVLSLVLVAAVVGAIVLTPAHLLDRWQFADFSATRSIGAGLLGWLHAGAVISAIALRVRGNVNRRAHGAGVRAVATVLLLFVLPGLLTGESRWGRAALTLLDAGGILRASFDFPVSGAQWIVASMPILGWGALATALAAPSTGLPQVHALRHPR